LGALDPEDGGFNPTAYSNLDPETSLNLPVGEHIRKRDKKHPEYYSPGTIRKNGSDIYDEDSLDQAGNPCIKSFRSLTDEEKAELDAVNKAQVNYYAPKRPLAGFPDDGTDGDPDRNGTPSTGFPSTHPAMNRARNRAASEAASDKKHAAALDARLGGRLKETIFHGQMYETYYRLGPARSPHMLRLKLQELQMSGHFTLPLPSLEEIGFWEKTFGWFSRSLRRDEGVMRTLDDAAIMDMSSTVGKFRVILSTEIDRVADMQLANPEFVLTKKVKDVETLVKLAFMLDEKSKSLTSDAGKSNSALGLLAKAKSQGLSIKDVEAIREKAREEIRRMREEEKSSSPPTRQ
jgi:hypothetical protein